VTSPQSDHRMLEYRRAAYAWAYRIVGNHHDAADIAQNVLVKWVEVRSNGSPPSNALGWLRRVTINQSLNLFRSQSRQRIKSNEINNVVACNDVTVNDDECEGHASRLTRAVVAAMEGMTEHQRIVLFAKIYDGLTFARIAEQLEIAVPTVKTHYVRALKTARRSLLSAGIESGDVS
jgi:RNA polymerase sigma-70 factor, ECF subfamily